MNDVAARSAKLYYYLTQSLSRWERGQELLRSCSKRQSLNACGYEAVHHAAIQHRVLHGSEREQREFGGSCDLKFFLRERRETTRIRPGSRPCGDFFNSVISLGPQGGLTYSWGFKAFQGPQNQNPFGLKDDKAMLRVSQVNASNHLNLNVHFNGEDELTFTRLSLALAFPHIFFFVGCVA